PILEFRFEPQLSTWVAIPLEPPGPIRLNDQNLQNRAPVPLENGDRLAFLGFQIGFRLIPATPEAAGRPVEVIPLPKSGVLVIGRRDRNAAAPAGGFVGLDADDQTISS